MKITKFEDVYEIQQSGTSPLKDRSDFQLLMILALYFEFQGQYFMLNNITKKVEDKNQRYTYNLKVNDQVYKVKTQGKIKICVWRPQTQMDDFVKLVFFGAFLGDPQLKKTLLLNAEFEHDLSMLSYWTTLWHKKYKLMRKMIQFYIESDKNEITTPLFLKLKLLNVCVDIPEDTQVLNILNQRHYIRWGWLASLQKDIELLPEPNEASPRLLRDTNFVFVRQT